MKVKGIIFEDTVNYKKVSMTVMMPKCDFKCDRECGMCICQNSHLAHQEEITIEDIGKFIDRYYLDNSITEAIVFQGLEPLDSFEDLIDFIKLFITKSKDDIVIYTGYNKKEIEDKVSKLKDIIKDNTLIMKYGRFIPNQDPHYDEVLGIKLASDNQYAIIEN